MAKHYRLWLEIEGCDPESDAYESAEEPIHLARCETLEEAIALRYTLLEKLGLENLICSP